MADNYTIYHLHSCFSNGTTSFDSTVRPEAYVHRAADEGMRALGFAEHGNVFGWISKKNAIERAGLKYIHAIETYVTERIADDNGEPVKQRDNYHCVLIARDYEGVLEINRLASKAFTREDGHFYYMPRITMDELEGTSEHIIVTTACLGGLLYKPQNEAFRARVLAFLLKHKDRCFLEVQQHITIEQMELNRMADALHRRYGLRLIAGTDTHELNALGEKCRELEQNIHGVHFDEESGFCLRFLTRPELEEMYARQGTLSRETYMEAIDNTNVMCDMIEEFSLDRTPKYPRVADDPDAAFAEKIAECVREHPVVSKRYDADTIRARVDMEAAAFKQTGSMMYMLLMRKIIEFCRREHIYIGPGRGSVAGSFVAWLLGITDIDPIKFNLSFSRFCNKDRVSLADIDTDWDEGDRDKIFYHVLHDHMGQDNIRSCQIITFGTIQMRQAIKDVGKALGMSIDETNAIAKQEVDGDVPPDVRKAHPQLFKYADELVGAVSHLGQHAAGVIISDTGHDLGAELGLCTSTTSPYPISQVDMDDVSHMNFVKMDFLGLKTVGVINRACQMAGLEHLTPDNIDCEDEAVWKDIRADTTGIFQYEKKYAQNYLSKLMSDENIENSRDLDKNFSFLDRFALGNGLLRPGCASFRDEAGEGLYKEYPIVEMNELLAPSLGYLVFQETIMQWLVKFCGYSDSESDTVRRAIAHKGDVKALTDEIKQRFLDYTPVHYGVSQRTAEELIDPFIQTILDASSYAFSRNHSIPYSFVGYVCGYLRHYYPHEFLAAAIDIFAGDAEKVAAYVSWGKAHGIEFSPMQYGKSRSFTAVDKKNNKLYQNLIPVKGVSAAAAEALYETSQSVHSKYFSDVLFALRGTAARGTALRSLMDVDFFAPLGNMSEIHAVYEIWDNVKDRKLFTPERLNELGVLERAGEFASNINSKGQPLKKYNVYDMPAMMRAVEDAIHARNLPDYCMKAKIDLQMELMGYISCHTGRPRDRLKLYIQEMRPMHSKKDGRVWGYALNAVSLGTGKSAELTLYAKTQDHNPIRAGDIIMTTYPDPRDLQVNPMRYYNTDKGMSKNKNGYWILNSYKMLTEPDGSMKPRALD